jgi:hypothetical protein
MKKLQVILNVHEAHFEDVKRELQLFGRTYSAEILGHGGYPFEQPDLVSVVSIEEIL